MHRTRRIHRCKWVRGKKQKIEFKNNKKWRRSNWIKQRWKRRRGGKKRVGKGDNDQKKIPKGNPKS